MALYFEPVVWSTELDKMLVRERHLIIFVRNFRPCGKIGSPLSSIVKSSYAKGSIGMKSRNAKKKMKKKK